MNHFKSILFAFGLLTTTAIACGPMDVVEETSTGPGIDEHREVLSNAVWADDESQYAYQVLRYTQNLSGAHNNRNQVMVRNSNGSGEFPLTAERPGRASGELYFMKSAGYLLMGVHDETYAHQIQEKSYLKFTLNEGGTLAQTETLFTFSYSSCRSRIFSLVPSPDGQTLALLTQHEGCTDGVDFFGSGPITLKIQFFNVDTMNELNSHYITFENDPTGWRWTDDGSLQITDGLKGVEVSAFIRPAMMGAVPTCVLPKTTSSSHRDDGQSLVVQNGNVIFGAVELEKAFGCP